MLRLSCPYCGPRDETEFRWGGDAHPASPAEDCSDQEWADHLFVRRNPRGPNHERWVHEAGCRQWFIVERDSLTHAILAVHRLGAELEGTPQPAAAAARP